jgi:hypothetical protein
VATDQDGPTVSRIRNNASDQQLTSYFEYRLNALTAAIPQGIGPNNGAIAQSRSARGRPTCWLPQVAIARPAVRKGEKAIEILDSSLDKVEEPHSPRDERSYRAYDRHGSHRCLNTARLGE